MPVTIENLLFFKHDHGHDSGAEAWVIFAWVKIGYFEHSDDYDVTVTSGY